MPKRDIELDVRIKTLTNSTNHESVNSSRFIAEITVVFHKIEIATSGCAQDVEC